MEYKNFEDYLQTQFMNEREFGGIPIMKDNCEDLFDSWLQNMDVDEWLGWADSYANGLLESRKDEVLP